MKIKKSDKVLISKGKDKGKTAKVEKVIPAKNQVVLTGFNVYKKHLKPSKKNPHGGIIDINLPISVSNIMVICPRCERSTRISHKIVSKKKLRICKKCKEPLD